MDDRWNFRKNEGYRQWTGFGSEKDADGKWLTPQEGGLLTEEEKKKSKH